MALLTLLMPTVLLLRLLQDVEEGGVVAAVSEEQVGLGSISSDIANSFSAVRIDSVFGAGPIGPLPPLLLFLLIPLELEEDAAADCVVSDETVDVD